MPKRINSKKKGSRAELALSHELTRLFKVDARRGQQYQGGQDSPDIVFDKRISIECKHVNKLNINQAMLQSKNDSAPSQVPVVIHKADFKPWLVTVPLDDLIKFAKIIVNIACEGEKNEAAALNDLGINVTRVTMPKRPFQPVIPTTTGADTETKTRKTRKSRAKPHA
jgi:hypothetical protein